MWWWYEWRLVSIEIKPLVKKYKFYLAIENSRCREYITEKLFFNALLSYAVPIVAGTTRSDYEKLVPANSFIHVDDFETLDDLAGRINYLLKPENHGEYMSYLSWWNQPSDSFRARFSTLADHRENFGWCKLCRLAKQIQNQEYSRLESLHSNFSLKRFYKM